MILYSSQYINSLLPFTLKLLLKLPVIVFFLSLFILEIKMNNDKLLFISYFLFNLVRVLICIINNNIDGNLMGLLYNDMLIIPSLIIIVYLNAKYHLVIFMKLIIIYFLAYLLFGIIEEIINGFSFVVLFYSNRNHIYHYNIILLITYSLYLILFNKKNKIVILYIITSMLIILQATLHNSKTSLISFLIIFISTLFLTFFNINNVLFLFKPINSVLYNIIIWCILMLDFVFKPLTNKVAIFLGKSTDFSGRRRLWNAGLKAVIENPFGFRIVTEKSLLTFFNDHYNTFHNFYIEVLYSGGILGFLLFLFFLFYITFNLNKVKNIKYRLGSFFMVFAILLRFQFESWWINCIFCSLAIIYFFVKYNNRITENIR